MKKKPLKAYNQEYSNYAMNTTNTSTMEFLSPEDLSELKGWTTVSPKKPCKTTKKTVKTATTEFKFEFSRINHEDAMLLLENSQMTEANFISVPVPKYTGMGQTVIVREDIKETTTGLINKLNSLDRVLKNPDHHDKYREVVKSFIDKVSVDYSTKQICMLDWITGTGKTVNGTLLSLLHAINMDKQLVIIIPSTKLSNEMSIASEIKQMLETVIDPSLIFNVQENNIKKDKFYRVIISTPRMLTRIINKITKQCIVFADEVDAYVNDENAIMKSLYDETSSQSMTRTLQKYNEILTFFTTERQRISQKNKYMYEIEMFNAMVEAKKLKEVNPIEASKLIANFNMEDIKNIASVCKKDPEYIKKITQFVDNVTGMFSKFQQKIECVIGNLQFYLQLIKPRYIEGQNVKQEFTKLNYVFDEENLNMCITTLENINRYMNREKINVGTLVSLQFRETRRDTSELDQFCSFYYNVQPSIMICASATMNVQLMGYYTPTEIISTYIDSEKTTFSFKHFVSPIKINIVNFSNPDTVDRITGCTTKRENKGWADIYSAKVNFYLEQCRPFLQGRTLIQCKGPSVRDDKLAVSQKDFIETALIEEYKNSGRMFTSDPDFYNDLSYDTIINTVDEATGLRGLNFRVNGVVMFEVGNKLNIKNLLQAIRVGRMCYEIEEEMNVIIFYRGYKSTQEGTTEEEVVSSFASILQEQGCAINRIKLDEFNTPDRQNVPQAEWSRNFFTSGVEETKSELATKLAREQNTDLTPIIRANRPVVCACTRNRCSFPHVRHCLGLLEKNGVCVEEIKRQLDNYPLFVPKETRLTVNIQKCMDNFRTVHKIECKNVASCKKLHYFEEDGKIYKYTTENTNKTPIHIFCKNAYSELFSCTSHHSTCTRITVPDSNHIHDCQLPHCEEYSRLRIFTYVPQERTEQKQSKMHVWNMMRVEESSAREEFETTEQRIERLFSELNQIRSTHRT